MNTNLNDYVKIYDRVLTKKQCDILINLFDTCENKEIHNTEYYKFQQVNLNRNMNHFKNILNILVDVFSFHFEMYRKELNINHLPKEFNCFEQFRIKKYEPNGKDEFAFHVDVGNHQTARRFLVFFWYLNDVYEGGETSFQRNRNSRIELMVKPQAGRMITFPPMWTHPHTGHKPISGPKYIIGGYLHYL